MSDSISLEEEAPEALIRASRKYSDAYLLRSAIQALPVVGGSLDTILAGKGSQWQINRLERFVEQLDDRLRRISSDTALRLEPTEPLYDFVMQVFDQVVRTRSDEKRALFANVVVRQIEIVRPWEEAESAARLLSDLSDLHIRVVLASLEAPICNYPFEGLRVITIASTKFSSAGPVQPSDLRELFPELPPLSLRMYCAELVARGLLHDEGPGRIEMCAMTHFVATELAAWFMGWIKETGEI